MLLLCSRADALVDWQCSQAFSRAWGVPLRLHTEAGHDLPLDDPPWVARAVSEWLRTREMHAATPVAKRLDCVGTCLPGAQKSRAGWCVLSDAG